MTEDQSEPEVKRGDLVHLRGGVTAMFVVSVGPAGVHCSLLPFKLGEPVIIVPTSQLEAWPNDAPKSGVL